MDENSHSVIFEGDNIIDVKNLLLPMIYLQATLFGYQMELIISKTKKNYL